MRISGKLSITVMFIVCLCAQARLQAAGAEPFSITAKEIIENVQDTYDDMKDAVVTFSQAVRFKTSRSEQQTTGTLYFKKKNKHRIETEQRTIVTDGVTSWSWTPQNRQVIVSGYKEDSRSLSPERILLQAPKDYYATLVGQEKVLNETCYVLKLTPRENSGLSRSIKVWIAKNWTIRKVEIIEAGGTVTTYTITEILMNKGIPDSRFEYTPPQGVDVIDLR